MTRGFSTIMAAQFFSSLADNALFVVAVALLRASDASAWQQAALVPVFAVFYVILAPWVGAFADAHPKGRVMFLANAIKVAGCLMMLFGSHPLLAYAVVGLGAAAYSPAKYGILTELLTPSQLVKGNGWMEALTIGSIILGVVLGGQLVVPHLWDGLMRLDWPLADSLAHHPTRTAIGVLVLVYALAALINLGIPRTGARLRRLPRRAKWLLLPDFWRCNRRLWRDPLGQISLATTTLFWGVSGNMRFIVLAWAAVALGYDTTDAANLVGVVIVGTALGALVASMRIQLDRAATVIPMGIGMGAMLIAMVFVRHVSVAVPFLILLGALGGYVVVPMNALLQYRGHDLVGAGRSIAVQNFNEQACILAMGALYSVATAAGLSTWQAIVLFGLVTLVFVVLIGQRHRNNLRHRPQAIQDALKMTGTRPAPPSRT